MPYATWNESPEQKDVYNNDHFSSSPSLSTGKALAKIFGYMGIALLITSLVATGLGYLFLFWIGKASLEGKIQGPALTYLVILGVSLIALLIDSFAMRKVLSRGTHSIWPHYIIYASLMGVFLSAFLFLGLDAWTFAEALGITAVSFGLMFLIGYFSKVNLNPLGLVALGFLFLALLLGGFWGIWYLIAPEAFPIIDAIFSLIMAGVMMIIVAVDAYNVKKILLSGEKSENMYLYCAFVMYGDFLAILVRVIYILLLAKKR